MSFVNPSRALLAAVVMLLAACGSEAPNDAGTTQAAVEANIQTVKSQEVAQHYYASGNVTSDHRIAVSSRLSGYIRQIAAREGERVKKGEVLVRIDPVDAKQNLAQAKADLADAKTDFDRFKELLAANAVSKQQYDKAELRYKVALSRLAQAENQLSYAEITSPVDGIVVQKLLNTGDLAGPGMPVLIVEDPAQLLVETSVSEQYIDALHVGDAVDLHIPSAAAPLNGKIRQLVDAADPGTHQFLVKVSIDGSDAVRPGMFAEVGFRTGSRQALLIPQAAVVHRSGLTGIYLVDAKNIVHYRQIRLGTAAGNDVEVVAGLVDGDRIAWSGTEALQNGMPVRAGN
ncbi:MAG TPA: efflux RND transporter periplasmic adaptor subunit [Mariprofundaceae bacterium]|nr:efflux RND transporter periplasmic adaptor subunit [Mariprofundaceae bacterium]